MRSLTYWKQACSQPYPYIHFVSTHTLVQSRHAARSGSDDKVSRGVSPLAYHVSQHRGNLLPFIAPQYLKRGSILAYHVSQHRGNLLPFIAPQYLQRGSIFFPDLLIQECFENGGMRWWVPLETIDLYPLLQARLQQCYGQL